MEEGGGAAMRQRQEDLLRRMMRDEMNGKGDGLFEARPFQVEVARHLGYLGNNVCCVQKTGLGKSVPSLASLVHLGGVYVMVVPLLSLGSNQVYDAHAMCDAVEATHVDDLGGAGLKQLLAELDKVQSRDDCCRMLYISPQSLMNDSPLKKTLHRLIDRGLVCGAGTDEVHRVGLDAVYFRKEWLCLRANLWDVLVKNKVPILAQTATLTHEVLQTFIKVSGVTFQHYEIGDMCRRNIALSVKYAHNPLDLIKPLVKEAVGNGKKAMVFSNHQTRVVKNLVPALERELGEGTDIVGVHGDTGDMTKAYRVRSFCDPFDSPSQSFLNCRVMVCTKCTREGINSRDCGLTVFEFPSDLYDYVQGAGRVRAQDSDYPYKSVAALTVAGFSKLVLRISTCENEADKKSQTKEMWKIMTALNLPAQCMHLEVESQFSNPREPVKRRRHTRGPAARGSCGSMCAYCNPADHGLEELLVADRKKVIKVIDMAFRNGDRLPSKVTSFLYENKAYIWKPNQSKITAAHANRLMLRLLASRILTYSIKKNDDPKINDSVQLDWNCLDAKTFRYARSDRWRWRGIKFPLREAGVWCSYDGSSGGSMGDDGSSSSDSSSDSDDMDGDSDEEGDGGGGGAAQGQATTAMDSSG